MKKNSLEKRTTKEKKEKHDNLDNDEKQQLIKYQKKGKKVVC